MIDILGNGRVGAALSARARTAGLDVTCIGRRDDAGILADHPGRPLLLATRNDDLESALSRVPHNRRDDVVFAQNGMLRPFLLDRGWQASTRTLLFFAVAQRGDDITGGTASPAYGPHAASMAAFGEAIAVPFTSVDATTFADRELEKLLWLVIFGTLGGATGQPVGVVADRHREEVVALVAELAPIGRTAIPAALPNDGLVAALLAYTASVASWRAAPREHSWRAGWFLEAAAAHTLPTPHFSRWLAHLAR
ncbi:MAG: hypothetical protein RLZZ383_2022 [Pseudomonadota bacterium]|jgi:ketopantoate reductase